MNTTSVNRPFPLRFFVLVGVLTIPFWVLGAMANLELMPGLPVSAFAVVCPLLAAVILTYRENKMVGVKALLKRAFDFKRITAQVWYLPALLLMPLVTVVAFVVQRSTGTDVPDPHITLIPTLILFLVFFVSAIAEELGWSAYATDPLLDRWGVLCTGLILGIVWAVWHYVALGQAHRSVEWIAWWSLGTVTSRMIMVWLYNRSGRSVFIPVLFHMMINVMWQLYPVNGSYFDPRISGLILTAVVIVISVFSAARPRSYLG